MNLYTIGFTKTSAEYFFTRLQNAGVCRLIDVRLNNNSQLSGFAKKNDLRYFLKALCGIDYEHREELAPTQNILDAYKKMQGDWSTYEDLFLALMEERKVENLIKHATLENACLLCSEDKSDHCHRRLVAEYLQRKWNDIEIIHI